METYGEQVVKGQAGRPVVIEQVGSVVRIAHGGALALGSFLVFGPHMGVVRSHERAFALVELLFERGAGGRWGAVRRPVRTGSPASALDATTWATLLGQQFTDPIEVGRVRQEDLVCNAIVSDLTEMRAIVVGKSGSGKSTALMSLIAASRNTLSERLRPGEARPFGLILDLHGDYCGRVRDRENRLRPNLVDCLREEPVIVGPGDLACVAGDVPATSIVRMLEGLSAAQKRWTATYVTSDSSHEPLRTLWDPQREQDWPTAFRDLTAGGVLSKAAQESLVALRAKLRALLAPPLFRSTGQSTWPRFLEYLSEGRTVIVDVAAFPPTQQPLLAILVLRTLLERQFGALRAGRVLQRGFVVADEAHRLKVAASAFEACFREARKAGFGLILGSQRLAEFPAAVLSNASTAVVMRMEGADADASLRRWGALKPVASELRNLAPGAGFVLVNSFALPIEFDEPAMAYGHGRRRGGIVAA